VEGPSLPLGAFQLDGVHRVVLIGEQRQRNLKGNPPMETSRVGRWSYSLTTTSRCMEE
jgi:hypothetical protein